MRLRTFFWANAICACSLFASEKMEIVAKFVEHKNDIVTATGGASAYGQGYYIKADKIIYYKNNDRIEAIGNVFALKDSTVYAVCDNVEFNLNDKTAHFDKFFLQNQSDDIWVSSKDADLKKRHYDLNKSITSSCAPDNPQWHISYDKGRYDSDDKSMTLSNATFYVGETPILYSPYFSFSLDKTRRSGLLTPQVGYKANEGLIYGQPFYFAPSPDSKWDSELTPQLRTIRGAGIYETLRFKDSQYSMGMLSLGYFKDSKSFQNQYNLKYSSHLGYSALYERLKIFADTTKGEQDGFYANLNYLNDIDYKNLQEISNNQNVQNLDRITTSKINYYYQKENNYFGTYLRYYIDTSKTSNDDTLQQLPKLQYHRYLDSVYSDKVLYGGDVKVTRYDRKYGLGATQYEGYMPVSLSLSFFDDLLGVGITENIYTNKVSFSKNTSTSFDDYYYTSNTHKLKLFTTLLKPYESFYHTLDFESIYTKPAFKSEKNYPGTTNDLARQVVSSQEIENNSFKLVQFFYDLKGSQILMHRLAQTVYADASRVEYKYSDMENEVTIKLAEGVSLSTDIFYSHKQEKISSAVTSITAQSDDGKLTFSQTYKNANTNGFLDKADYLSLNFERNFGYTYYGFGGYDYDYKLKDVRSWTAGMGMKSKCMNYKLSLKKETTPILTSTTSSSIKNYVVYFSINFVPIGGINQVYSVKTIQ
jgi:LPS-assembly protein